MTSPSRTSTYLSIDLAAANCAYHAAAAVCWFICSCGCLPSASTQPASGPARAVVIYCSADEAFARPLLHQFELHSGVAVRPVFDSEAGKTTGLVERLRAERNRPIADVWWSSEIFGTIQLAEAGALAEFRPAAASDIPDGFRDPAGRWTAFGLRGRVLAYATARTTEAALPRSWRELAMIGGTARIALANPQFGTTRGHMAALLHAWGEPAFIEYLEALHRGGVRIADGNAQTVLMTARGQVEFGWTDTDDVRVAQRRGDQVNGVLLPLSVPDGPAADSAATPIWIPNTAALVEGGPNPEGGRQLVEFIASARMERSLFESESGNIPVRPALRRELGIDVNPGAPPDYAAIAALLPRSDEISRRILQR